MMLIALGALILAAGGSVTASTDGGGEAQIDFNGVSGRQIGVRCGSVGTWTVTYTVPDGGMAVGGGIRILRVPNKYWLGQCKQMEDPTAPDYFTAARSDGGAIEVTYLGRFYKDHREAEVAVRETPLAAGERIVLRFGDTSGGSIGAVVPFSWQPACIFRVDSDLDGDGAAAPLAHPLVVVPEAGEAAKLVVDLPLVAGAGEKLTLAVRIEDSGSNVVQGFAGEVELSCTDKEAESPRSLRIDRSDRGIGTATVILRTPGIHYFSARIAGSSAAGSSNPVKVTSGTPDTRVYWGDLHLHTEESDGTGSLDFNFDYARDVSRLDFAAVVDHLVWDAGKPAVSCDGPIRRTLDEWNDVQSAAAARHHSPGRFVTLLGYEWSGENRVGGDHNVYYSDQSSRVRCSPDLREEYEDIRARGNKRALAIPHVGGRVANADWHDPLVEPSLEINSMHGHFEWFAQDYLGRGCRVGFNGGSDGHFGLPGNDVWPNHGRLGLARRDVSVPQGVAMIYASDLTGTSLIEGLYSRRTYATTGVKMLLDVEVDGRPMGAEFSSNTRPAMHILAAGTSKIARIEIIRGDERIYNRSLDSEIVEIDFTDDEPVQGTTCYYVRVSQDDGEIAWSSPVFFTYTGPPVDRRRERVPWNYEAEQDEPGGPVDEDYLPALLDHLKWRAPDRFYELRQVRMVRNPRGSYALFYGRDRANGGGKIHIRWYVGFDSFRLHISRGWRDFGSEPE